MTGVQRRKRKMVEQMIQDHLDRYKASGAELIMGTARFVAPKTVEVARTAAEQERLRASVYSST